MSTFNSLCTCLVVWFTRSSTCSFVCSYAKLVRWDTNALLLRQPKATHFIVFVFSHSKSVPDILPSTYTERTTFDYFYQRRTEEIPLQNIPTISVALILKNEFVIRVMLVSSVLFCCVCCLSLACSPARLS